MNSEAGRRTLEGVRAVALDRPGFDLSEPARVPRECFRDAAVEFLGRGPRRARAADVRARRQLDGRTWALWYALARPERVRGLVLLGSAPLLPDTRPPVPLRVRPRRWSATAAPLVKPNRELLIRLMASMGEKDTIVRYPQLIESLGAAAREPINSAANLAELQAIISPFGFRRSARMAPGRAAAV